MGHQKGALLGQTPALPTNIRLGWKGLSGTNTLAYYEKPKITCIKSFIILAPDVILNLNFCPNYFSFFIWVKNSLFFTVLVFYDNFIISNQCNKTIQQPYQGLKNLKKDCSLK